MSSDTLNITALLEAEQFYHNYFGIDTDEIGDIVKRKIPQLKIELQKLV